MLVSGRRQYHHVDSDVALREQPIWLSMEKRTISSVFGINTRIRYLAIIDGHSLQWLHTRFEL